VVNAPKIKVSKEEFTEVLCFWLSQRLTKQAIKQTAKKFNFKIKSNEDFNKILQELFALNMWLVVRTCERVLMDTDRRNECLDMFHRAVYEVHITDATDEGFREWMLAVASKYVEYNKAAQQASEPGPVWWLARLVNQNIFGEVKEDIILQVEISAYVGILYETLEDLIKKYDIE
jgi:hypothetical protein